jgi:DNA invertase Pin-like site-specific DNA recombinase
MPRQHNDPLHLEGPGAAPQHRAPAAGYLRRSTDKQDASIPDQTKAVQQYANEHGYRLVRWYTDDAISGDDTDNRPDFKRLHADALQRGADFKTILCWDQDRFGRFDSIEAGFWIHPLRKAGVRLVTVVDGPVDWDNFTGRVTNLIKQEGHHEYLQKLSRDVARGQLEAANNGSWLGAVPYAYRLEGRRKNKRLVLDDPAQARIVRRIFHEYVVDGRSPHDIADRLNADGVVAPCGRVGRWVVTQGKGEWVEGWHWYTVRTILENPAYTGDYAGCRHSYGKYNTIRNGRVVKSEGRRKRPPEEWIVRPNTHEAIIDRATFAAAQERLAKGKTGRTRYTPDTNPYRLSGLLRCGRCGHALHGLDSRGSYRYYGCSNRRDNGKHACAGTTVREDRVLESIADYLEGWLGFGVAEAVGTAAYYGDLKEDDLPEAFALVRRILTPPATPKRDRRRLEKQAADLEAKLAKARSNLVLLDAKNIPAAQERIDQLDAEFMALREELKRSKPPADRDLNAVALQVLNSLYALAYCCRVLARPAVEVDADGVEWETVGSLESIAPQAVKRFLSKVGHIVCHTVIEGHKTATRHRLERGEIVFAPAPVGLDTSGP